MHHQALRIRAAAVHKSGKYLARDRRATRIFRNRHRHPFVVFSWDSTARVIALPAARQTHIAQIALGRNDSYATAAIGHVVPQKAARL